MIASNFYPNGSRRPTVPPKYLVVVASGAYGYNEADDALEAARQLTANGRPATAMMAS